MISDDRVKWTRRGDGECSPQQKAMHVYHSRVEDKTQQGNYERALAEDLTTLCLDSPLISSSGLYTNVLCNLKKVHVEAFGSLSCGG
ncbi:predicted protein [Coccidioides posadasii str. Silveira]|uniref:Predicted protein n=1 Tax=Coccidioides posadasii (strain RMSCC 757 / Silveira) TaxID=443226 RepID=E9D1S9_COCPS|nr:predicted protein [Coccidioides posadasii str. Silveira]